MIELDRASFRAGTFVLQPLSLTVETGEYAVVMGRTGCGKTTLLEGIAGLRKLASGTVRLMGRDVSSLVPGARQVGYVPQDLALFPTLTVAEHLRFALDIRRLPDNGRVQTVASMLGITHLLQRMPQGLSGGESQRVALGRALSFRPPVLLLDEPLSALDEETRAEMVALLKTVQQAEGLTVLHVTHSKAEALALADRLFRLEKGELREEK